MMFGLILTIMLIGWIGAVLWGFSKEKHAQVVFKADFVVRAIAILFLIFALGFGILGYKNGEDFGANLATTFGSIAVTVLLLDRLNSRRIFEQRKQEIIEEVQSPVRDVAVEAMRLIRKYNWLAEVIEKVNLRDAQLAGANLVGAKLIGVNFKGANLQNANLDGAALDYVLFMTANLSEASMVKASLNWASFQGANLVSAKLMDANLKNADLFAADLRQAILMGTILVGADLRAAELRGADLRYAIYTSKTKWSEDFDPQAAGAILVGDEEATN